MKGGSYFNRLYFPETVAIESRESYLVVCIFFKRLTPSATHFLI